MRPRVIVHIATSLDGRIDHGHGDIDLFYSLISRWREDVTLSGSVTCTSMGYARDPGDLTTIEDPTALQQIKDLVG